MKDYLPKTDPLYDKVISALETVRPYLQVMAATASSSASPRIWSSM